MRRAALALLLFWAGCSGGERVSLIRSDLDLAIVAIERDGALVSADLVRLGPSDKRELELEAGTTVLVAAMPTEWFASIEGWAAERSGDLALALTPPPPVLGPARPGAGGAVRDAPLPADLEVLAFTAGTDRAFRPDAGARERLRAEVTIAVPVAADYCAPPKGRTLRRFAELAGLNIGEVVGIDGDHALVNLRSLLAVVERGGGIVVMISTGDLPRGAPPPPGHVERFVGVRVDPRPQAGGRRGLWITTCHYLAPDDACVASTPTRLFHAVADPSGLAEVRLATAARGRFERIEADVEGRVFLAGDGSHAVLYDVDRGETLPDLPFAPDQQPNEIAATGDRDEPFVVSSGGSVYLLDARSRGWNMIRARIVPVAFYGIAVRRDPAGVREIWAGGSDGELSYQRGGEEFTEDPFRLPADFSRCARSEKRVARDIEQLDLSPTHLLVTAEHCTSLLAMRLRDHCTVSLIPEGETVDIIPATFGRLGIEHDRILAPRDGTIFELEIE